MILIDSKEPKRIFDILKKKGLDVKREFLEVGDYVLGDGIIIERKECRDFISSIYDNRLWEQASNLARADKPILCIIEPNKWREFYFSKNRYIHSAYNGAICTLVRGYGITIVTLSDDSEFISFLENMEKQILSKKSSTRPVKMAKRAITLQDRKENCLAAIEGVSINKAKSLLECFGTIKNIANSNVDELQLSPGIGKKLAENIYKTLNE